MGEGAVRPGEEAARSRRKLGQKFWSERRDFARWGRFGPWIKRSALGCVSIVFGAWCGVSDGSRLFDADEFVATASGHRQVLVEHDDRSEWIDEGVAELIAACWRTGIETVASCQGHAGECAWIWLPCRPETVARFAEIACDASDDSAGEWEWTATPTHVMVRFPCWAAAGAVGRLRSADAAA